MKCPYDKKTKMSEPDDYLNRCPHCGVEVFAVRRQINDLVKHWDNRVFDYSLPFEEFKVAVDTGFWPLAERAYEKVRKLHF